MVEITYEIKTCLDCPFGCKRLIPNFISAESHGVRLVCDADYRLIKDVVWYWGKGYDIPDEEIPPIPEWCPIQKTKNQIIMFVKKQEEYDENLHGTPIRS
jgi:hypothetical protein